MILLPVMPILMDSRQKERILFRNEMLPYSLYTPNPHGCLLGDIPWHWHDEFEFGSLLRGSILYKTSRHEYILREGDGIFINSGTLHYLHPLEPRENVLFQSQFFSGEFLAGARGNLFDLKYIAPVQGQKLLDARPLYRENSRDASFLDKLLDASRIAQSDEAFSQLRLRSLFSELWEDVYRWAAETGSENAPSPYSEDERIKDMLSFIQQNFSHRLTVRQIAGVIPISERECYRLFKKHLGISPVEYLTDIRLQKARELLIESDKCILDIALETGFGSSSYFGKIFKHQIGITPKAYRRGISHIDNP